MKDFFPNSLEMWYKDHQRQLPWRQTRDPYSVWISEIILQQTRVVQGLDYYNRFMARFPRVEDLAGASLDEVLRLWQGLGYYSRARNLYAAANQIVSQGGFPTTYEGVRALKGVGDYTAAAICSFAYGFPCAVVDGNVYRVLSRVFGVEEPIDSTKGKKLFAQLAQELLDKDRPALYNQAIMDFGAVQCVPQSPDCLSCPLQEHCAAFAGHQVERLPVKSHKTKVTDRYFHYLQVRVGDEMLLHQRGEGDIWQNLYEIPLIEAPQQLSVPELVRQPLVQQLGFTQIRLIRAQVKHVLSHRILHADLYLLESDKWPETLPEGYFRIPVAQLDRYAIPRLVEILLHEF